MRLSAISEKKKSLSICSSLLYSLFNLLVFLLFDDYWYFVLFSIYLMFSFIKTVSLKQREEYLFIGVLIITIDVLFGLLSAMRFIEERVFIKNKILMIAIATYTFTKLGFFIGNARKKRYSDLAISFTELLISVASLERSMLGTFSDGKDMRVMEAVSDFCFFAAIMAAAFYLIAKRKDHGQ